MGKPVGTATTAYQPPPVQNDHEIKNQPANQNQNPDPEIASPSPSTPQYSPQEKGRLIAEKQTTNNVLEDELRRRFGTNKKQQETEIAKAPDSAFDDADDLKVGDKDHDFPAMANTVGSMLRSDLNGTKPGNFQNVMKNFEAGSERDKDDYRYALHDSFENKDYRKWVESDPKRHRDVENIVRKMAKPDPSPAENAKTNEAVDKFKDWKNYPNDVIIVPGYTPLDQKTPLQGVHPDGKERLKLAKEAFDSHKAPFILLSGGNVYPRHTTTNEAKSMKDELIKMGVPEDRIIVDMQARHSTTNLRNAGRYMIDHDMGRGLIITKGGGPDCFDQAFYFRNPDLSTFNSRCKSDLGYQVGELNPGDEATEIKFKPSPDVKRFNYRDPLDP